MLKDKGYKLTEQRQVIWNVMIDNLGEHLSSKEIWEIARQKDDTIGIATVYRTLQIMDEIGVISSFDKKDENKYELLNEDEAHVHPHLICMHCGKIIGIADNLFIGDPAAKIYNEYKFEIEDIHIKCYGVCNECAAKDRNLGG